MVLLDLATSPVTVTGWATTRCQQQCAAVSATDMRDVDVSPDGSYFVVVTTGAYRAGSLCDAAALDPVNGLPLSWNPGRDRGVGVFALVATVQGLWIGRDTERMAATSATPASPSCPWPAAPRCPSPASAPCQATCSAGHGRRHDP